MRWPAIHSNSKSYSQVTKKKRMCPVGDRLLHIGDENWEAIHFISIRLEKYKDIPWAISKSQTVILNIYGFDFLYFSGCSEFIKHNGKCLHFYIFLLLAFNIPRNLSINKLCFEGNIFIWGFSPVSAKLSFPWLSHPMLSNN